MIGQATARLLRGRAGDGGAGPRRPRFQTSSAAELDLIACPISPAIGLSASRVLSNSRMTAAMRPMYDRPIVIYDGVSRPRCGPPAECHLGTIVRISSLAQALSRLPAKSRSCLFENVMHVAVWPGENEPQVHRSPTHPACPQPAKPGRRPPPGTAWSCVSYAAARHRVRLRLRIGPIARTAADRQHAAYQANPHDIDLDSACHPAIPAH
jgi:hypothetical protein